MCSINVTTITRKMLLVWKFSNLPMTTYFGHFCCSLVTAPITPMSLHLEYVSGCAKMTLFFDITPCKLYAPSLYNFAPAITHSCLNCSLAILLVIKLVTDVWKSTAVSIVTICMASLWHIFLMLTALICTNQHIPVTERVRAVLGNTNYYWFEAGDRFL